MAQSEVRAKELSGVLGSTKEESGSRADAPVLLGEGSGVKKWVPAHGARFCVGRAQHVQLLFEVLLEEA